MDIILTTKKVFFCILGAIFLAVGLVGTWTPLLPHMPFFLLSVSCFALGSKRIHAWVLSNRLIGPSVKDWQEHRRIRRKAKLLAMVSILISFGYSIYVVGQPWQKVMLIFIGIAVSTFILTRKSE
jgi:uncharacterized membrane protein YbaN (DUF454 family)